MKIYVRYLSDFYFFSIGLLMGILVVIKIDEFDSHFSLEAQKISHFIHSDETFCIVDRCLVGILPKYQHPPVSYTCLPISCFSKTFHFHLKDLALFRSLLHLLIKN